MSEQKADAEEWLPFVVSVASRFYCTGAEKEELIQSGAVGLMKAIKGFRSESRAAFASYAFKYIEGEIRSYLRSNRLITVPRKTLDKMIRLKALMCSSEKESGERMRVSDAAKLLSVSEEEIVSLILLTEDVQSLAILRDPCESEKLIDSAETEESVANRIVLTGALKRLPEFENAVMRSRFFGGRSQTETAKVLGVNQSAVSKAEARAIRKLRETIGEEDRLE